MALLAGGAILLPAPVVSATNRTAARLQRVQEHSSSVNASPGQEGHGQERAEFQVHAAIRDVLLSLEELLEHNEVFVLTYEVHYS